LISDEDTNDEKNEAGVNAAAFRRYFETESRQFKGGAVTKDRHRGKTEKGIGGVSGSMLGKARNPGFCSKGKGNQEEQKTEWEGDPAQGLLWDEQSANADQK
jgi:hypothetical protein